MSEILTNVNKAMEAGKWAQATANCPECKKLFPKHCSNHQKQLEELQKKYKV
jgi:hypothetical protein